MVFGPIALSFAPFPFYPLHAPQSGPQKTSQTYVILVQVASLDDFNDVTDMVFMTSWCIRHRFDDILMYPPLFWSHFSLSDNLFHDFSENVLPALVGTAILDIDAKHFASKISLFRLQNGSDKIHFGHVIFSRIALLLVSFPLYSLDATQAGPQKTSQICAVLLQVA